jgi:hypothetical protein
MISRFSFSVKNHSENDNQDTNQEHKNRNPVDTVHIADPAACRFIRILFPQIKIFSQFTKYSHLDIKVNSEERPGFLQN